MNKRRGPDVGPSCSSVCESNPGFWVDHVKREDKIREEWYNNYGEFYFEPLPGPSVFKDPSGTLCAAVPPMKDRCYLSEDIAPRSQPVAYLNACIREKGRKEAVRGNVTTDSRLHCQCEPQNVIKSPLPQGPGGMMPGAAADVLPLNCNETEGLDPVPVNQVCFERSANNCSSGKEPHASNDCGYCSAKDKTQRGSLLNEKGQRRSSYETETDDESENLTKYDENLDMDEEKRTLVRFREERMEQLFPDEKDTPADVSAKNRYQRYRGLKSFRHSDWDPMQNLPPEYARIFRFENFRQMKKKVMKAERQGALPGLYVTIHIINVPESLYDSIESSPLIIYGLLPHEQKMSFVNVVIKKHPSCTEPIKSKDRLIFHLGFRRFVCQPLFSEHSACSKHKLERFLPNDTAVVASFFAPVTFPPCSAVVFQQKLDGTYALVATGSVLDVNPDRLIIKRTVLSGHPFRTSCGLSAYKYGRKGHILEPLGTHGHMKCVFD